MAITQRFALNAAIQYNEIDLSDYLINDATTGKKFLTHAPLQRLLRATESAALYFATNDTNLNASALYRFYDANGGLLSEQEISLVGAETQSAIAVNQQMLEQPADAVKLTVQIISGVNLFVNSNFSQGTGDNFTGWTKTEVLPSDIIESTQGGLNGTRCLMMFASSGSINISQSVALVNGVTYTIQFYARVDELISGAFVTGPAESTPIDSTEWTQYEQTFVQFGTGTIPITLDYSNDLSEGYVYLDDVKIFASPRTALSELRTYLYDTECVSNEIELNWLNKLGGRDSYVFTGFPIEDRSVDRITPIEYPRLNNYSSPNRIYANRQNISRKGYTITTRCKNRSVAVWLREDIMDSIDVMMRVNGEYLPVEVLDASMVTNDTFSQDYSVRFRIRLAYDINVQTR